MTSTDLRVVVAIDFGTTYSGFAYAYVVDPDITVNESWPGLNGSRVVNPKTNTVLQYDENWNVTHWGIPALACEPRRRRSRSNRTVESRPVELFKLHLADIPSYQKPDLPYGLDFRKAIRDYLAQMKPLIQDTLSRRWPGIKFSQVRFVFSVPAEWKPHTIGILQDCIYNAGYLENIHSNKNLEFTTEPEAAALYCMKKLGEHKLTTKASFLVVDCGGGTVDLTTRQLLEDGALSEITERTGDLCGSTYVDNQFRLFLKKKLGKTAVELFESKHYGQYQYLIHDFFCPRVKCAFTGDPTNFKVIELDIEKKCPVLIDYVTDEKIREEMEEDEWLIEINFQDVLEMFDPVVDKILALIRNQLSASKQNCSAMFLVGGFAESPYLVKRIEKNFSSEVPIITVPQNPITAVLRGAVIYGLNKKSVANRMLTMSYGVEVRSEWKEGVDPKKRKIEDGRIDKFSCLAKRGRVVASDEKCSGIYYPVYPNQTSIKFKVFATPKLNQRFCDEPGMKEIGELNIDLPDTHLGVNRSVEFGLCFGELLITATARNQKNGKVYTAKFKYTSSGYSFDGATTN